jgi:hypothetical protein
MMPTVASPPNSEGIEEAMRIMEKVPSITTEADAERIERIIDRGKKILESRRDYFTKAHDCTVMCRIIGAVTSLQLTKYQLDKNTCPVCGNPKDLCKIQK